MRIVKGDLEDELTLFSAKTPDVVRRRTQPQNIPLAVTMKNDEHRSMSMQAFGPPELRYQQITDK